MTKKKKEEGYKLSKRKRSWKKFMLKKIVNKRTEGFSIVISKLKTIPKLKKIITNYFVLNIYKF